jgi:hypothetical protein
VCGRLLPDRGVRAGGPGAFAGRYCRDGGRHLIVNRKEATVSYDMWLQAPYQAAAEAADSFADFCDAHDLDPGTPQALAAYEQARDDALEAAAEDRAEAAAEL